MMCFSFTMCHDVPSGRSPDCSQAEFTVFFSHGYLVKQFILFTAIFKHQIELYCMWMT